MSNLHICSLRSGSKGNSTLVFSNTTKILVDCGISCKMAVSALSDIGISPYDINAVVVTHEHGDHIKGINLFSGKYAIPVFANSDTWTSMRNSLDRVCEECVKIIEEESVKIGDINVCAFPISHDAANPVGYTFVAGDEKISVATDMGTVTPAVYAALQGSDKILLEANHDVNLLSMGAYPQMLKRRILGDFGHLCNDRAGEIALSLLNSGTKNFLLGHLSRENNNPDLAYATVLEFLSRKGAKEGKDFTLDMTYPEKISKII